MLEYACGGELYKKLQKLEKFDELTCAKVNIYLHPHDYLEVLASLLTRCLPAYLLACCLHLEQPLLFGNGIIAIQSVIYSIGPTDISRVLIGT